MSAALVQPPVAMVRKGLSMDEKCTKMLEIFHDTKSFFTIKELEKIAPKQKGITQQTVQEVLDLLLAEDKIQKDKVGTSSLYWVCSQGLWVHTDGAAVD